MHRGALQGAAIVAAILVIASGTKSFSSQRAGFGIETSSGYQVSNVKYWLGGDSEVRSVNFDLDAPAHVVSARLQSAGRWYVCRSTGSASWSCVVPESAALGMNEADAFQVRAH